MIRSFSGKFRFLSNFHPAEVEMPLAIVEGRTPMITLPTVEHAYQASKAGTFLQFVCQTDTTLRKYRQLTPGQTKRLGRQVSLRPGWDEARLEVMEYLLTQKFAPGTELAESLRRTGNQPLVEGNRWHDNFWGVCECSKCRTQGATNHLGVLLMKIRRELRDGS